MRARHLAAVLAISLGLGAGSTAAFGFWSGFDTALHGTSAGGAGAVNQGPSPSPAAHGNYVVLSWGTSSLTTGQAVDGYEVKRYDAATNAPQTLLTNCTGTIAGTSCTESNVPAGEWKYTVTPVVGESWRGEESELSGIAQTGPTVLELDRTVIGPPLPTNIAGTLTGFAPNEGITFTFDGAPMAGSPSSVGGDGTVTITSLTIPAGISDGSHTIRVIGDEPGAPSQAEASVLVDTTAPSIVPFTTPPANAAGWNNTSPVEVSATVDDGNGSGLAYAKYTDDGTDPKTSPTAQYATAPLSIAVTTTLKYFVRDLAGNESPVESLEVKIDTTTPLFNVDLVDPVGAYITPTSPEGVPGLLYYRGAAAGSMRFRVTPIPMGGSPAVSAGFAPLTAEAVGFSFDSTSITEPEGGPYVSNTLSWVAGTTSRPFGAITLLNAAGTSFGDSGGIHNDSTAPSGGSVDASGLTGTGGRYSTSLDLSLDLAKGTDTAVGVADGSAPDDLPAQLMRASAPLSSADGVANGSCGAYSAYSQVGADDPAATVSDTVPADGTCYRYRYLVADHLGNAAEYESPDIKVRATPTSSLRPTDAIITPVSGISAQSISGSTAYYNPALLGSFDVDSSASAPFVGVANMTFPVIAGFTGGGAQTTPSSGTTFRSTYAWSGNEASPSPGVQPISATNHAGSTATNATAFSVVKDDLAPAGGSVDATGLGGTGGRYSTSTTLNLAFTPGSDAGSGLATGGRQLMRASASLTSNGTSDGICGTFGEATQVGLDPVSPATDTVPVDRTCYRYQYVVSDKVGNQAIYTSPDIKVAVAVPPAPTLSFSNLTSAYWSGTGNAVFYRPAAASGGFRVTASSADTTSGTTGYGFPTLPGGWSGSSGGNGIQNYSWSSANPTAPSGAQTVTATNNAGRQWTTNFTATPDSTAPSGGSVSYTNGYSTGTTVSVTFTKGTDSGSGLASTSGLMQRSSATLSAGACGTFGAFTTVSTNPATSPYSNSVTTGNCYQYRYLISDNVGNQATFSSASIVKVDSTAPTNSLSLNSAVGASLTGTTLYYKSNAVGSFRIVNAVADAGSGPASTTFPVISTTGWVHNAETISTPVGGPYTSSPFSWTATPANPTAKTVTGRDAANRTTNVSVTFVSDITGPAGGTISYTDGLVNSLSVPVTTSEGNDVGSGINPAAGIVQRSQATLDTATQLCGAFGSFSTVTLSAGADTGVSNGNCYQYRYLASDKVGNQVTYTSASVARVDTGTYANAVSSASSLVNYYRLGEYTVASDSFTGSPGTLLQARTGETGASWSHSGTDQTDAVLTDANRLRRSGVGAAMYSASGTPSSADYSVHADITVKSLMDQEAVALLGRVTAGDNYYLARYISNGAGTGTLQLAKVINGAITVLGSTPTTLTVGQTYAARLRMVGTSLTFSVDGAPVASATDGSLTAAGKGGVRFGFTGATPAPTNTTGLHLDNFGVTPVALDAKSGNHGDYLNTPTLGTAGAISTSADTAVQFNGTDEYASIPRQIQDDFSIEFWFKSTQGLNTGGQWWEGAGLVDAEVNGALNDFGVSLRADGRVVAGIGTPDVSIISSSGGYNNGGWHHVVFTRAKAAGALALYVDGALAGSATGASTLSLTSPTTINFGRLASAANYFAGALDEVALYSSVLSQATVSDHYGRR